MSTATSVGGLGDVFIDIPRLHRIKTPGLAGDVAGVADPHLHRLHSGPQLGKAVLQIQGITHQARGGVRRQLESPTQLRGSELGHLRGALTTQEHRPLTTRPPLISRVHRVLIVEHRVLIRSPQNQQFGAAHRGMQHVNLVEESTPRQPRKLRVNHRHCLHKNSQTETTDSARSRLVVAQMMEREGGHGEVVVGVADDGVDVVGTVLHVVELDDQVGLWSR